MPAIEIIEEDEDGGFDLDAVVDENPASTISPASDGAESSFHPSATFTGRREGYVFKTGALGTGFYADAKATFGEKLTPPAPLPATPPPRPELALLHPKDADANTEPQSVEVTFTAGGGVGPNDLDIRVKSDGKLDVRSERWTAPMTVDLGHTVTPDLARAWVHEGIATLRVPVAAG
eukprot:CAMPEP_0205922388 /NCGR_PEP_ID=MMETSP1325-20131115/14391_1 /ASSEMBLY_ACC=CAM_ASM_000708 /TAXON_ID=236786 /ORGANISM="Florenciella sp., Strain RCC1007" /LENGTH=176 /DNA_ID=CAMNT_0053290385 /DNA_START=17 /DNA_END=547 /DNA_ORIENTATION=+